MSNRIGTFRVFRRNKATHEEVQPLRKEGRKASGHVKVIWIFLDLNLNDAHVWLYDSIRKHWYHLSVLVSSLAHGGEEGSASGGRGLPHRPHRRQVHNLPPTLLKSQVKENLKIF